MTSPASDTPHLLAALKEAQDTVRAYDTKAQIVGVGYIFALRVAGGIGAENPAPAPFEPWIILVAWAFVMTPIFFFGMVLYPSRKVAPKLAGSAGSVGHMLYVEPDRADDVDAYLEAAGECDWRREIAYELMKTSGLRDLKRTRFLRALFAAALGFLLVFLERRVRILNRGFPFGSNRDSL